MRAVACLRVHARRLVRACGLYPWHACCAILLAPHLQLELGAAQHARHLRAGLMRGKRGKRLVDRGGALLLDDRLVRRVKLDKARRG